MALFDEFLFEYGADYYLEKNSLVPPDCFGLMVKTRDGLTVRFEVPKSEIGYHSYYVSDYRRYITFKDEKFEKYVVDKCKYLIDTERRKRRDGFMTKVNEDSLKLYNTLFTNSSKQLYKLPEIKKVIFNYPATIVIWEDSTKTVTKCYGDDVYDKQKGLLICIGKKVLGGASALKKTMNKWIPDDTSTNEK